MEMNRGLDNSANNNRSSGVVESGKIFIVNDERGGGERVGPKHSLMNTTHHIDYHIHRFGANKSKVQAKHKVFTGSAKDGIFATQELTRIAGPAKDRKPTVSPAKQTCKNSGARHFNQSRGENSKQYISSPSGSYNNSSRPPHRSNQSIGCIPYFSAS